MKSIKLSIGALALGLLAACGGSGGGGGGPVITGGVVKGPVLGSTVCAFALNNGVKGTQVQLSQAPNSSGTFSGGCYVTGADGTYAFALPAGTTADLLIEATGGKFCTNETPIVNDACPGGGTIVDLGTGAMSAVVAGGGNGTVYTTPLTTAAVANAGANLTPATFSTQFNTLAGAVIGAGTNVTPATPPNATNQPYLVTAAQSLNSGGTLSSIVSTLAQGTTTFGSGSGNTPATVAAALVGSYDLKFYAAGAGCAGITGCNFTDGQDVPVVVHGDGRLAIAGKVLTNPFYRNYGSGPHLYEVIWLDTETNLEYALSDNVEPHFNEINVADASQPQGPLNMPKFIGQIRRPEPSTSGLLAQIAGTYTNPRQYAGANIAWTEITIGADGAVSFTGTGPAISSSQVATVTSWINCCGRIDIMANFNLNGTGGVDNDDKIMLFVDADGKLKDVEYYVGASNVSTSKRGVSVLGSGQSYAAIGTGTWAIPNTNVVTGTVDGTVVELPIINFGGVTTSGFTVWAEAGNQVWAINIANSAGIAANTNYSCVHNIATNDRSVEFKPNASASLNSKFGGNCNVYVTEVTSSGSTITAMKGRFSAELYSDHRKTKTVILDGAFSYTPTP